MVPRFDSKAAMDLFVLICLWLLGLLNFRGCPLTTTSSERQSRWSFGKLASQSRASDFEADDLESNISNSYFAIIRLLPQIHDLQSFFDFSHICFNLFLIQITVSKKKPSLWVAFDTAMLEPVFLFSIYLGNSQSHSRYLITSGFSDTFFGHRDRCWCSFAPLEGSRYESDRIVALKHRKENRRQKMSRTRLRSVRLRASPKQVFVVSPTTLRSQRSQKGSLTTDWNALSMLELRSDHSGSWCWTP